MGVEAVLGLWQNGIMLKKCQKHLSTVHENYFQHLCFAGCFGFRMIGAGMAAILHGLCPAVFQYTGSATINKLHDEIKARQQTHGDHNHHG